MNIRSMKLADKGVEPAFFSQQIDEARRFFLRLRPPWNEGFNVVCGGNEHCASDYHIRRDGFPYVTVEFVAQGEGTVVLKERKYEVMTGAIFVYGPGVAHDIQCHRQKPMTKYFASFAGPEVLKKLVRPRAGEMVQSSAPEQIAEIFEQLIDAGKRDTRFQEQVCRLIGEQLLLRIAETAVPLGTMGTEAFGTYQLCRGWMDRNYRSVESLAQIASACGIGDTYLCRLFKRHAHRSPWQHILRL